MPWKAHGQFSVRQGPGLAVLSLKMHFPGGGIAQTRYDSLRARTGARIDAGTDEEAEAVLCLGGPGGSRPARAVGRLFSRRGRRLPALRRHRGELPAARHLRHHQLGPDRTYALAAAGISSILGGNFRAL